jgi:hypothetical protein
LQVKSATASGTPKTLTKSMGNLNNGTFKVGLTFPNVPVAPNQTAVFNYLIVNSGHKTESAIYTALETAGSSLAQKGLVTGGTAIGSVILPGLGTILGAAAGWLAGEVKDILTANCDGPVAAEQLTLTYSDLLAKTSNGSYKHETPNHGTNSPTGCGGNSMYYVTWDVARGVTLPPPSKASDQRQGDEVLHSAVSGG